MEEVAGAVTAISPRASDRLERAMAVATRDARLEFAASVAKRDALLALVHQPYPAYATPRISNSPPRATPSKPSIPRSSAERGDGKEWLSTFTSRWAPEH